jgi:hypothetical protein
MGPGVAGRGRAGEAGEQQAKTAARAGCRAVAGLSLRRAAAEATLGKGMGRSEGRAGHRAGGKLNPRP